MKRKQKIILGAVLVVALLAVAFFRGGLPGGEVHPDESRDIMGMEAGGVEVWEEYDDLIDDKDIAWEEEQQSSFWDLGAEGDRQEDAPPAETESKGDTSASGGKPAASGQNNVTPSTVFVKPVFVPPSAGGSGQTGGNAVCTISIRCDTVLQNLDRLDSAKHSLIPENGVILPSVSVAFQEGDSAFDILQAETKRRGIHLEYTKTILYNTYYIEGIANLYELDCGEGSGWMYSVNGTFLSQGSSNYIIQPGDAIVFHYTCDLGKDLGSDGGERE